MLRCLRRCFAHVGFEIAFFASSLEIIRHVGAKMAGKSALRCGLGAQLVLFWMDLGSIWGRLFAILAHGSDSKNM